MIKEIKWFIQRGKRGWADCDIWGLEYYLTKLLIGTISQLRKEAHGFPAKLTAEKWDEILGQMVKHLQAHLDAEDNAVTLKEIKAGEVELQKGLRLICKWYGHLWD